MPRPAWLSLSKRDASTRPMPPDPDQPPALPGDPLAWLAGFLGRHWRPLVLLFWLGTAIYLIWERWSGIQSFGLGDTDDNLRMMQVRAWLIEGQGWYDLRQYRLSPPDGLSIHWSRLVDLPLAGIYLLLTPLIGGAAAERWAVAVAPLLPLIIALFALALAARRLLGPLAFMLPLALILTGGSVLYQFAPLRIDHHSWQLAMLAVAVAGLADPHPARGGLTMGIASAVSLVIGLEMLLYLALAGVATGLFWVRDPAEARRLLAYGVSFAGAAALGFLLFASNDNWAPMCDALSPVWLSVVLVAGGIAVVLAWASPASVWVRLGLALVGGAALAGMYALLWPDCLGRLERVPEELDRLWLSNVREARPLWMHDRDTQIAILTLPVIGLIGYLAALWYTRREPELFKRWAALAAMSALAAGLLAWQTRAAAAAQLLAVIGASALAWLLVGWFMRQRSVLVKVAGIAGSMLLVSGAVVAETAGWFKDQTPPSVGAQAISTANWRCPQMQMMRPVALQPKGQVLTFVDLGPRLITLTHHDAIAGPYHRNAQAILDVMRAFRGDFANAKSIIDRRGVDYVLICPNMSESTIYRADAPQGFYSQLSEGKVPGWLEPVALPADSPFRMWRVRR